ncbi:MAG: beta-lactamase family protein [Clostridia bacterium]|nr:beta-lactamase family protein [Clostridia bacterium]
MNTEKIDTKKWNELLDKGVEDGAFPCYASAVGRGNELFFKSLGGNRALYPTKLPLTKDTLFDMASLSKLIGTTMAALRLIEKGKLSLNDRVGDFFESCYGKEDITIYQLMTHTSGIPSFFHMWKMNIDPRDAARVILEHPLSAPAGSSVIYSCMGYILLGKILEKICGESLDKIVQREVLAPLDMKDTCYCPTPDRICVSTEKKAGSDEYICGHVHDENAYSIGGISGNAGLFSTLDDCIKFASMISREGEGFLKKSTFDLAISDHTEKISSSARGLGFQLYRDEIYPGGQMMSRGSYGHSGFTGTYIYVDKDTKIFCIFLSNRVHFGRETDLFFERKLEFFNRVFSDIRGIEL